MKILSLFSGIGAFEKALTNLQIDYELVGFSEIDKYAIESYCAIHNVDKSLNLGDISKIEDEDLPNADLITYGFPCQDISVIGLGEGIKEGSRSGLLYEAERIINHIKPRYAIAENVKNLIGKKHKKDFEELISRLESYGYNNYWKVLNAKDYGIPQNRERVFIVSIRKDVDDGNFNFNYKIQNDFTFKDTTYEEYDKYLLSDKQIERIISTKYGKNTRYKLTTSKLTSGSLYGDYIMDYRYDEGLRIRRNNLIPTLTTKSRNSISGVPIIYRNGKLRQISPKECWINMGFDSFDFERVKNIGMSENQLYKQAGNSIVVDVIQEIFRELLM